MSRPEIITLINGGKRLLGKDLLQIYGLFWKGMAHATYQNPDGWRRQIWGRGDENK